jgi:uncharacterized repeat protein (TIGR03809 family)
MARSFAPALDQVAQKWRGLAERRRAHFVALFHSGRWKHYYSEQQFLDSLREAVRMSERWAEIAPSPAADAEQTRSNLDVPRD